MRLLYNFMVVLYFLIYYNWNNLKKWWDQRFDDEYVPDNGYRLMINWIAHEYEAGA
jgi:hypothetical protein